MEQRNTRYTDKFKAIRPFVKLKIPHNKKNLTNSEKSQISRYYNALKKRGYLNNEREGYVIKNIDNTSFKKYPLLPKQKAIWVKVGTEIKDGKIVTNTKNKPIIRNGEIYIKHGKNFISKQIRYDIGRDWKKAGFRKHLKERLGKVNAKNIVAVNAGDVSIMKTDGMMTEAQYIEQLADNILKMAVKYRSDYIEGERESEPEDFMGLITIYESPEIARKMIFGETPRKKRKSKYAQKRMK